MRLDKYLKVSRLIKRRTVANEACDAGRVLVNGKAAKPGLEIKPEDVIQIRFGKDIQNIPEISFDLQLPGKGIINKQCFSHNSSSMSRGLLSALTLEKAFSMIPSSLIR